jgi:hypothetical protein
MATVLERFNKLGLASSNPVLIKAGQHVADLWNTHTCSPDYNYLRHKIQIEADKEYCVRDYPESFIPEMDRVILKFIEGNGQAN